MDEVRQFRFFIPVAIFVVTVLAISPDTVKQGISFGIRIVGAAQADKQPANLQLLPIAALLGIGASLTIGFGFINSTVVNAILVLIRKCIFDYRMQVGQRTIRDFYAQSHVEGRSDNTDFDAIVCSAFQHCSPQPLKDFMARRWEMFIISVNSAMAILWAFAVAIKTRGPCELNGWESVVFAIIAAALLYSAWQSRREIGLMTDFLSESRWLQGKNRPL